MFSKFHLIHVLFFVGILNLLSVTPTYHDEEYGKHDLLDVGWDVRCKLQPNSWLCYTNQSAEHRYYYDNTVRACKTFIYGGCALSFNRFYSTEECYSSCHATQPLTLEKLKDISMEVSCRLQHDFGSCFSYEPSFYYDISTRTCKGFSYSGCGGNANRFGSIIECMDVCEPIMPQFKQVRPRGRRRK